MKSGSRLERILARGEFAVTGELGPPKSGDPEVVREKARLLKGSVDAVNITDCQTAIVRMSSIGAGLIALQEGVEPVIQMTCRDRNRIGMQSDILGAAALGLKNLLCLTGDHQKFGNHPMAKGVFDMDSIQMLGMVKAMRDDQVFQCGEAIKAPAPKLFLGAAANPFAHPFEFRAARLGKKVAAGADFIQTQIIYNVEKFARFMEMVRELGLLDKVHILAGVTPPKSLGMARYMKKFVPGMEVTDEVIKRMQGAKDKEDEGINICVDIINQVRAIQGVAGVHIMAIEWEKAVPEIVSRAKLGPRPVFADDGTAPPLAAARQPGATAAVPMVLRGPIAGEQPGIPEGDDAGEHAMNERERQIALEQVRGGLEALKEALGISDKQFEALTKFTAACATLEKEPPAGVAAVTAAAPPPVKVEAKVVEKAVEPKAAEVAAKKAAAEAASKAEAEKKAAEEAARQKAATEVASKKAEAEKKATAVAASKAVPAPKEAPPAKPPAQPAVKPSPRSSAAETPAALAVETTPLAERAARVPDNSYKQVYSGAIRETVLGSKGHTLTVGGAKTLPFYLFEGEMPNRPIVAMDVLDVAPDEWPASLARHFEGVLNDPVAWARKCVTDFNMEAICLSLVSTDPNGLNRPSSEAAKKAVEVVNGVDVPVILWGCGNADKDTETLREITAMIGDKKVCLGPLSDANYRSLGATAMAFGHPMIAASPIDVNLAKQLNILLENLGVSLDTVLVDPSIGALGYGIEYSYSVMERIRLAALTQKDEKLQVPLICNLGREVWKAKETRLPTDAMIGDQERRGVLMEAITATCMLMAGGEVLIMRHPRAVALTKALISGLMG